MIDQWETFAVCRGLLGSLSTSEVDVMRHCMAGRSYIDMAERLGRSRTAVDNALQRIKHKAGLQVTACHDA